MKSSFNTLSKDELSTVLPFLTARDIVRLSSASRGTEKQVENVFHSSSVGSALQNKQVMSSLLVLKSVQGLMRAPDQVPAVYINSFHQWKLQTLVFGCYFAVIMMMLSLTDVRVALLMGSSVAVTALACCVLSNQQHSQRLNGRMRWNGSSINVLSSYLKGWICDALGANDMLTNSENTLSDIESKLKMVLEAEVKKQLQLHQVDTDRQLLYHKALLSKVRDLDGLAMKTPLYLKDKARKLMRILLTLGVFFVSYSLFFSKAQSYFLAQLKIKQIHFNLLSAMVYCQNECAEAEFAENLSLAKVSDGNGLSILIASVLIVSGGIWSWGVIFTSDFSRYHRTMQLTGESLMLFFMVKFFSLIMMVTAGFGLHLAESLPKPGWTEALSLSSCLYKRGFDVNIADMSAGAVAQFNKEKFTALWQKAANSGCQPVAQASWQPELVLEQAEAMVQNYRSVHLDTSSYVQVVQWMLCLTFTMVAVVAANTYFSQILHYVESKAGAKHNEIKRKLDCLLEPGVIETKGTDAEPIAERDLQAMELGQIRR